MRVAFEASVRAKGDCRRNEEIIPQRDWNALQTLFGLSPRQRQVTQLVCRALDNKMIAAELSLSVDTVRMHLKEVFRKMQVDSRVGLVVQLVSANRTLSRRPASALPAPEPGCDALRTGHVVGRMDQSGLIPRPSGLGMRNSPPHPKM